MPVYSKDAEIWGDNPRPFYLLTEEEEDEDFDEFDEYEQEERRKDWEIV